MFDLFSWSHILILLTVALVVVGPKDLPKLMHMAGKWAGKARAMATEFKKSFDDMARQSELDELRKEIEELRTSAQGSMDKMNADLQVPLEEMNADLDIGPEPRSGEFQVTDAKEAAAKPAAPQPGAPSILSAARADEPNVT